MEAMRVRRQRRRHPPDARGGHLGSAATSTGFTVDLWKEGRAHPTWDDLGGVSPRRAPPDANIAASLGHYNGLSLPPEFQHLLREHHQHPALRQTPR
jgi:hypothetical protein